jgi:hypothetical protein
MGRPFKMLQGLMPLDVWWRVINHRKKQAKAALREKRKAHDKGRRKCRCEAYPWPHRPGGGFCRHPDPPLQCWQRKEHRRPYRKRYAGLRRQIARANKLHPIKDRELIQELVPHALEMAKLVKERNKRVRYREVEITDRGVCVYLPQIGPEWEKG